jgi:hypothetical protein
MGHPIVEGVHPVRPVERDAAEAAFDREEDALTHGMPF